jgi:hypothetical protein
MCDPRDGTTIDELTRARQQQGPSAAAWGDLVMWNLLRREAEGLIAGPKP